MTKIVDLVCATLIMVFCHPMGWIGMIIFFVGLNYVVNP